MKDVLVSLVNDLDTQAGRTVVALDDHYVIDSAVTHQGVAFLLDNLPPQVPITMTTGADPTLPIARLRARGQLVEVRASDRRFTHDEATQFNDTMGLQLYPALVTALGTNRKLGCRPAARSATGVLPPRTTGRSPQGPSPRAAGKARRSPQLGQQPGTLRPGLR